MFPAIDSLHLVKKIVWLLIAHLAGNLNQIRKILQHESHQTLVLEIHVDNLIPVDSGRYKFPHDGVKHGRFSRPAKPCQNIVGIRLKIILPGADDRIPDDFMLLVNYLF